MKMYESIQKLMKAYQSVCKHMKAYQSIWERIKAYESISKWTALPSSFILIRLVIAIIAPKSVLLKCETAWEAFKQVTIKRPRNKEKQRNKEHLT